MFSSGSLSSRVAATTTANRTIEPYARAVSHIGWTVAGIKVIRPETAIVDATPTSPVVCSHVIVFRHAPGRYAVQMVAEGCVLPVADPIKSVIQVVSVRAVRHPVKIEIVAMTDVVGIVVCAPEILSTVVRKDDAQTTAWAECAVPLLTQAMSAEGVLDLPTTAHQKVSALMIALGESADCLQMRATIAAPVLVQPNIAILSVSAWMIVRGVFVVHLPSRDSIAALVLAQRNIALRPGSARTTALVWNVVFLPIWATVADNALLTPNTAIQTGFVSMIAMVGCVGFHQWKDSTVEHVPELPITAHLPVCARMTVQEDRVEHLQMRVTTVEPALGKWNTAPFSDNALTIVTAGNVDHHHTLAMTAELVQDRPCIALSWGNARMTAKGENADYLRK